MDSSMNFCGDNGNNGTVTLPKMSLLTALENMSDADLKTMALFQALRDTDSVSSIKYDSGNLYHVAACESSKPGIKRARRIEELINNIQEQMITERMMKMTI